METLSRACVVVLWLLPLKLVQVALRVAVDVLKRNALLGVVEPKWNPPVVAASICL